jgi:hypothetical protein
MPDGPELVYSGRDLAIHYVPAATSGRSYRLVEQGLEAHPAVTLVESEAEADFVLYEHQAWDPALTFPRDKLVYVDYSDDPMTIYPVDPIAYFKRSWPYPASFGRSPEELRGVPQHVLELPRRPPLYHPLPYAVMDEFVVEDELERDIDLACFLRPNFLRRRLLLTLLGLIHTPGLNFHIGPVTDSLRTGFDGTYLRALRRSKIVVTSGPDLAEGDSRTWEALANGPLVIQPTLLTPVAHPLIDGEHTVYFNGDDLTDAASQNAFIDLVLGYLQRLDDAERIGSAGRDHALRHHRAVNRVDWMLGVITGT